MEERAGGRGVLSEETLERVGCEWVGEEESLREVAALHLERADLAVLLDALGERLQAERLAELDEGVRERVRRQRRRVEATVGERRVRPASGPRSRCRCSPSTGAAGGLTGRVRSAARMTDVPPEAVRWRGAARAAGSPLASRHP